VPLKIFQKITIDGSLIFPYRTIQSGRMLIVDADLTRFALDFRARAPVFGHVPVEVVATYKIQDVTAVVWYRKGPFQVEMFVVPPNYIIPEHTHPNVASYEMYVGGDISFSHGGRWVSEDDLVFVSDASDKRGGLIAVETDDLHGGAFGPSGGVFMSIQKWLNGVEPHSVAHDYDGVVMGGDHLDGVMSGDAKVKVDLTWRDAATLEDVPPYFDGVVDG
tara:strand:+ start:533 stop:1189 length:657 start_codon:yes stop_codon:yes gene_type:complete